MHNYRSTLPMQACMYALSAAAIPFLYTLQTPLALSLPCPRV